MAQDEALRRIDAHMKRGNELLEDLQTFMREMTLRHERVMLSVIDRLEAGTTELRELTKQSRAQRREFVEESRAQRAALFRILDRFDEGGATSGA